jgi:hypothetical protein
MGLFDFLKPKPKIPPEALTVWVHRKTHHQVLDHCGRLEGRKPAVVMPINEVFSASAALMTAEGPLRVTFDELAGLGLSAKEALKRGLMNALPALKSTAVSDGLFIWNTHLAEVLAMGGSLTASMLPIQGNPVAMVPAEGFALMAGSDDAAALGRMLDLAESTYAKSTQFRSLRAISWRGDKSAEWTPPQGHPLRTRFLAAAAVTRRHEAEVLHHVLSSDGAPLAHLAVMPSGALAAGWPRGANVVMPRVDSVVLLDTDDVPHPRLEVDFKTLLEALPHLFEEIAFPTTEGEPHRPALYRTRGACFPTPRERAFLIARMAWDRANPGCEDKQASAQALLAEWDSGAPVLVEGAPGDKVQLTSADRRHSSIDRGQLTPRVEALCARDQFMLETSFMAVEMIGGRDFPSLEQTRRLEALRDRMEGERPLLLGRAPSADERPEDPQQQILARMAENLDAARVMPMVRPPGYEQGARRNEEGMIAGSVRVEPTRVLRFERVSRPLYDGLSLELVCDQAKQVSPLNGQFVTGALREAAWRSAELNLQAASLEPLARSSCAGVYEGPWHDDYDASRVLLSTHLVAGCEVTGLPLVFAPTTGRVWVTGSEDLAGIEAVLNAIGSHFASGQGTSPYQYRQLLFGWPWVLEGDRLTRWKVPAHHPLAASISSLDQQLERRRAASTEHVKAFAQAAYSQGGQPNAGEA